MKGYCRKFFGKIFPCLKNKQEEEDKNITKIIDMVETIQDKLNSDERQKRLEEIRLHESQQDEPQPEVKDEPQPETKDEHQPEVKDEPQPEPELQPEPQPEQEQFEEHEKQEHQHNDKDEMIHCVFLHYAEKYEEFYSTRPTPIHSNFNEKMFKDLCQNFIFNNIEQLETCLNDYNIMRSMDRKAYKNLSKKRQLKCDLFNFYLFI